MQLITLTTVYSPMLGPGTEYGRLDVAPEGDLSNDPKGSRLLNDCRSCSLVIFIPCDHILPNKSETPAYGVSLLISCISDVRSASVMCVGGSSSRSYSTRLLYEQCYLYIVILLTPSRAATSVHLNPSEDKYSS